MVIGKGQPGRKKVDGGHCGRGHHGTGVRRTPRGGRAPSGRPSQWAHLHRRHLYSGQDVTVSTARDVSTFDGASGKWNDRNTCPDDDRRVGRVGTTTDPRRLIT